MPARGRRASRPPRCRTSPSRPRPSTKKTTLTADQALEALKEGNRLYQTDSPVRAVQGRERRIEIALGQTPFVVLVSCSDSRVSPEILFGRGLGELFIVRNAGNCVDTAALARSSTASRSSACRWSW